MKTSKNTHPLDSLNWKPFRDAHHSKNFSFMLNAVVICQNIALVKPNHPISWQVGSYATREKVLVQRSSLKNYDDRYLAPLLYI